MELDYQLTVREVEESLLCLDYRLEGWLKYLNMAVLMGISGRALTGYVLYSDRFFLLMLAFLSFVALAAALYIPKMRRRKKAEKMAAGTYQIKVPDKDIKIIRNNAEKVFEIMMQEG